MAHYDNVTTMDRYGAMVVGPRGFHGYSGIAPLGGGLTNVAFVFDVDVMKRRRMPLEAFFEQSVQALPPVREALVGGRRVSKILVSGRWHRGAARGCGRRTARRRRGGLPRSVHRRGGVQGAPERGTCGRDGGSGAEGGRTDAAILRPYLGARRAAFMEKTLANYLVQAFVHVPPLMNYVTPRLGSRPALARQLVLVLGDLGTKREQRALLSPVYLWNLLRP